MTSGSVAADSQQVRLTIAKVKTLLVKSLQTILREEGLRHTGVKSVLQARIINRESPPALTHSTKVTSRPSVPPSVPERVSSTDR